jgi:tight adherence protein C
VLYLIVALVALTAVLVVVLVVDLAPSRPAAVSRRLAEIELAGRDVAGALDRRRRLQQTEKLQKLFEMIGERMQEGRRDISAMRLRLIQAGYASPRAVPIFLGARIGVPVILAGAMLVLLPPLGLAWGQVMLATLWLGAMGYILPPFVIGSKLKNRQKEMQKALPDALDLMVVCVEAGLALNQAMVRVAEEIHRLSPVLSEQISLMNLEIRAGTPREEAFRNLGERTGVQDIKSLMAMLIQTDRFGTSIATALRVHADTLRTKRRQRAEEAAAKTTIKLVFPLVLFIFPAMFVVIIGPGLIQIVEALSGF